MAYEHIKFEIADSIAVIHLNRPEHMNAYTGIMGRELGDAYRNCDIDDSVRAIVVTGSGKAFCAGADLTKGDKTFATPVNKATFTATGVDPPAWEIRKPVIAAMNGHAAGVGFAIALQCDMRIAANEGKYGLVQVRRGIVADGYSHWTLPRLVGLERAADLMLTGRIVNGIEAAQIGLVSRSVPADEVLPAALQIARDIAANTAPLAVGMAKRLMWESLSLGWAEAGRRETEAVLYLMGSPDAKEGPTAFLQRRAPRWTQSVKNEWPKSDQETITKKQ